MLGITRAHGQRAKNCRATKIYDGLEFPLAVFAVLYEVLRTRESLSSPFPINVLKGFHIIVCIGIMYTGKPGFVPWLFRPPPHRLRLRGFGASGPVSGRFRAFSRPILFKVSGGYYNQY